MRATRAADKLGAMPNQPETIGDNLLTATIDALSEILADNDSMLASFVGIVHYQRVSDEDEVYKAYAVLTSDESPFVLAGSVEGLRVYADKVMHQQFSGAEADD